MNKKKETLKMVYTLSVFVAMASLDHAVIGLFPPLFSSIAAELDINISSLAFISGISYLVTAISSVVWGYLADRGGRKKLIMTGTIISAVSVFLTSTSHSYHELLFYQFLSGVGLGCIGSIGYSVLSDYIPKKYRGTLMSLWGMSQGFGGIAGAIIASIVSTAYSWRAPFQLVAVLSAFFLVLYSFIKEPKKGASEPDLEDAIKSGYEYNYRIEYRHLFGILAKRSNIWLVLQAFFLNLTTGVLIWLPTMYAAKIELLGYSNNTRIVVSGYLFAIFQLGGLLSMYFGYLGDRLQTRFPNGRAMLSCISVFAAMPLYILMFVMPLKYLNVTENASSITLLFQTLHQLLLNPWLLAMFIFSVGATAAQSANIPNWLALITDVNLPEHRATAFSIANMVAGIGRSVGNVMIGVVLAWLTNFFESPNNYILTLTLFQLFLMPASYFYYKVSKTSERDSTYVRKVIKRRARS